MQNALRLPTGGTVRIPAQLWEELQLLSVNLSVEMRRPVKESTLINLLLKEAVSNIDVSELAKKIEDD